jgi:hypothetical protein
MWADAIRERAGGQPVRKIVFVEDMTRYGLHVHLGLATRIDKIALQPLPQSPYDRIYDALIDDELRTAEPGAIWICKASAWPKIRMRIEIAGYTPVMLPPFRDRLLFRVVPTAGPRVAPR